MHISTTQGHAVLWREPKHRPEPLPWAGPDRNPSPVPRLWWGARPGWWTAAAAGGCWPPDRPCACTPGARTSSSSAVGVRRERETDVKAQTRDNTMGTTEACFAIDNHYLLEMCFLLTKYEFGRRQNVWPNWWYSRSYDFFLFIHLFLHLIHSFMWFIHLSHSYIRWFCSFIANFYFIYAFQ